jgi:hypothetical protein
MTDTTKATGHKLGRVLINGHVYIRPVIQVAAVTFDGVTCIVPVNELVDTIDGGETYAVQIKTMRLAEYERLAEFEGW